MVVVGGLERFRAIERHSGQYLNIQFNTGVFSIKFNSANQIQYIQYIQYLYCQDQLYEGVGGL
jgi:hypothetical protein